MINKHKSIKLSIGIIIGLIILLSGIKEVKSDSMIDGVRKAFTK